MNDDDTTKNEESLFKEAMHDVLPIKDDRVTHSNRKPRPIPLNHLQPETIKDDFADLSIETSDELSFQRPGIQNRLFSDLKRGYIEVESKLDLHGMRVVDARQAMQIFIRQSQQKRQRCVLIIHGKGQGSKNQQPILKQKTNQWLRQRDEVLAFCSAPSWNGGTGATYVLLSRKRQDDYR